MHWKESNLSSIAIRKIDDDLKGRLRMRSAERGHSMEEEVRQILRRALDQESPGPEKGLSRWIHRLFTELCRVELDMPKRTQPARYADFSE